MRNRTLVVLVVACLGAVVSGQSSAPSGQGKAAPAPAAAPAPIRPAGTVTELMTLVIRPASDAVFYITSRTPETSEAWLALQGQTLMLAESANVLMLPAHARGRARWLDDARLMREAARKAFEAAKARDLAALEALNDELYQSCVTCHDRIRGARKRPGR